MKKRLVRIMAALMSFVLIAGTDVSAGVEKSSYEGAYDEVLSVISDAVKAGSDYDSASEYVSNGLIEKLMYPGDSVLEEDIGYAIEDISGDGVPELIVGCDDDYTDNGKQSYIYSIFSLKNGKPVTVMEGWVRSSYRWLGDGQFF
nr:hypothetical protein [Lachnospiraceae bacterium]